MVFPTLNPSLPPIITPSLFLSSFLIFTVTFGLFCNHKLSPPPQRSQQVVRKKKKHCSRVQTRIVNNNQTPNTTASMMAKTKTKVLLSAFYLIPSHPAAPFRTGYFPFIKWSTCPPTQEIRTCCSLHCPIPTPFPPPGKLLQFSQKSSSYIPPCPSRSSASPFFL